MGSFKEITTGLELATRLCRDCKIILEVFLYLSKFSVVIIQVSQSTEISKKLYFIIYATARHLIMS